MKKFFLLLLLISNLAFADCKVDQASNLTSKRVVGEVTDLVKDISKQKCVVKYRININDEWHNVTWTHEGYEDGEFLCNTAVENGRKQLLTMLGGTFESETISVCKEGNTTAKRRWKKGDQGLEAEFVRDPKSKGYFTHIGVKCRMFRETYNDGLLRTNNGVICQTDDQLWTVVDKW